LNVSATAQEPVPPDAAPTPTSAAPRKIAIIDNIAYRAGPSPAWRLDIVMPETAGDERLPAIVIVHGGGWRSGSKRSRVYRTMALYYANKGYVTASVEYRLTGEAPFPACIEDVKCAVRWLRSHAAEYHIDPDSIGAFGHSAGAHLVLMLAMCPPSAGLEGDGGANEFSSKLTSVVAASTPTRYGRNGADPAWSPMTYVGEPRLPPTLLIHGTDDRTVAIAGTDEFVEALKKAGHEDLTYIRVENAPHSVAYENNLDQSFRAMDAFFDRTLKPQAATAKAHP
jgi:acetyl esterase/lipase